MKRTLSGIYRVRGRFNRMGECTLSNKKHDLYWYLYNRYSTKCHKLRLYYSDRSHFVFAKAKLLKKPI